MKTSRRRIILALVMAASTLQGCGCGHNRQVIVQERRGAPVQVNTRDGVRVKAPFVNVRVPAGKPSPAGQVNVPIVQPE